MSAPSPWSAAAATLFRQYDTGHLALVKVALSDPTPRTLYLATSQVMTPDGQTWQAALLSVDPIDAPGDHLTSGFSPCTGGFTIPRTTLGYGVDSGSAMSAYRWVGATVSFYAWDPRSANIADLAPMLLNAVIDDFDTDSLGIHFTCVQRRSSNQSIVPRYAQRSEFPRLPDASVGQPLPIIIGDGRSRGLRGDWAGGNHNADQQRYALRGGLIPASQCLQVDNGVGAPGNVKAQVAVAGHQLTSIIEASNLGNLAMKAGSEAALLDVPSTDVNLGGQLGSFFVDDSAAFCYAFIPFTDAEPQASPGDNERHLLDVNEYAFARLDYDAGKRNIKLNLGVLSSLGRITDIRVVAGYKCNSASDCGQQIEWRNNGIGSTFLVHASGMPSSTTPATTSVSMGAPATGNSLSAASANLWDFSAVDLYFSFKAGTWTGAKVDLYWVGVIAQYVPKTNTLKARKTTQVAQRKRVETGRMPWDTKTVTVYREVELAPAVLDLEGEFYAQPRGWGDGDVLDGLLAAKAWADAMSATGSTIKGGYGFEILTGYNDTLSYSVTGAPSNPYSATIAQGVYASGAAVAAAVQAAMNAQSGSHGKTFTVTYNASATNKFAITQSSGTGTLNNATGYATQLAYVLGYQLGNTPATGTSALVAGYAIPANTFYFAATGTGLIWKWSNAASTARDTLGFAAVDDGPTGCSVGDYAVTGNIVVTASNNGIYWYDATTNYTATLTPTYRFTGANAVIERAPDIASFVLVQYGGQAVAKIEQGVGVHGSMVDARALLKTWNQRDMVYFRSIVAATDVHTVLADLAAQSCSWFLLNRFTDKYVWVVWAKAPAASYAFTIGPDDVTTHGHLKVGTTGAVATASAVRVMHLYDALKKQMVSSAFVGIGGSGAGYDFLDIRSEYLSIATGVNDRFDFTGFTAILPPGDYTPIAMAQALNTAIAAQVGGAGVYFVNWGFQIVAGYNDKFDFSDGSVRLATVAAGTYTGETLAAALQAAMLATGATGITVTYSRTTLKFTVAKSSGTLTLLNFSGANATGACGWYVLGITAGADHSGALTYTSDQPREEERYSISARSSTFTILWETGAAGITGTKTNCSEVLGFLGLRDQAGTFSYLGDCPKNNREQAAALSAARYGGKREMVVSGEWIRDSATAREVCTRLHDLLVDTKITVRFSSTRVPDLERGRVITFSNKFDAFIPYPKAGSDGSWAGKNFYVVSTRQHMGDGGRWDNEVTAVEAV